LTYVIRQQSNNYGESVKKATFDQLLQPLAFLRLVQRLICRPQVRFVANEAQQGLGIVMPQL
jgi:hypothetical protein